MCGIIIFVAIIILFIIAFQMSTDTDYEDIWSSAVESFFEVCIKKETHP